MAHLTNFFFEFFYEIFTEDASLRVLYHDAKKSKMTKNSNEGGSCLKTNEMLHNDRSLYQLWGNQYGNSSKVSEKILERAGQSSNVKRFVSFHWFLISVLTLGKYGSSSRQYGKIPFGRTFCRRTSSLKSLRTCSMMPA